MPLPLLKKLTFENRLIRFLAFDLLLGFELSGLEIGNATSVIAGSLAIYLVLTSLIGRCPIEGLIGRIIKVPS